MLENGKNLINGGFVFLIMTTETGTQVKINFSNFAYSFIKFHEQYKQLCANVSDEKRRELLKSIRQVRSFVYEYLPFVDSNEVKRYAVREIDTMEEQLIRDNEFFLLCDVVDKTNPQKVRFNQLYFDFITRIFRVIGVYGDEMSKTFMPSRTDRYKLFKWSNNNYFFSEFANYKALCSKRLAEFDIRDFKRTFTYLLGFYFAFYLFIDEQSRFLVEELFNQILAFVLSTQNLKLISEDPRNLNKSQLTRIKEIDFTVHKALSSAYFRMNYSFSMFGVLPTMEHRVLMDRSTI